MASLKGSLEAFALADVLRLISHNHATGSLKVVRDSGDGIVYFREGQIYFAYTSLSREFLGQRLVNARLITQGQLLRVLDEQKKSGDRRLGDILADKGYVSREQLNEFLREQIQDAVFHLLQWELGTFDFEEGAISSQEVGLTDSVENLLMESSRRLEEWEVIRRKIPSAGVIVRLSPSPPEDAADINIKPEEWTLMVLADGERSVGDIAAAAERSEFEASRILYGLVTAGLLDVSDRLVLAGGAPPPGGPEDQEPVRPEDREPALETSREREPVPQEAPAEAGAEAAESPPEELREAEAADEGEAAVSKELLLKLIAGVRNL